MLLIIMFVTSVICMLIVFLPKLLVVMASCNLFLKSVCFIFLFGWLLYCLFVLDFGVMRSFILFSNQISLKKKHMHSS